MRLPLHLLSATLLVSAFAASSFCSAHEPDRARQRVLPRDDVIGPVGNRLPSSYRRRYNRPTNFGGRIAYWIAPSSQEAMAWHAASHRGDYDCDHPRAVEQYFYAKPYEMLAIGSRKRRTEIDEDREINPTVELNPVEIEELETEELDPEETDAEDLDSSEDQSDGDLPD